MNSNKNVQGQLVMLKGLFDHGRLVLRLLRDKRVPKYLKVLPVASLMYLLSPVDFIPEIAIPVVGLLDDFAAVLIGVETFIKLCPQEVVAEHRADLDGSAPYTGAAGSADKDTIDGEWRTK